MYNLSNTKLLLLVVSWDSNWLVTLYIIPNSSNLTRFEQNREASNVSIQTLTFDIHGFITVVVQINSEVVGGAVADTKIVSCYL